MRLRRAVRWWPAVLALLVVGFVGCVAQQADRPAVDSQAEQLLKAAGETFRQAPALSVSVASISDEYMDTGQLVQIAHKIEVVATRPNHLYLASKGDDGTDWAAWYDGHTVSMLDKVNNEYAGEEFNGTTPEMVMHLREKYDLDLPMSDLLAARIHAAATSQTREVTYVGLEAIAGTKAHHILCTQDDLDWQIWIDAGEKPLVLKLTIAFKNEPGHPGFEANFSNWNLKADVKADTFAFTPPSGATKVQISDLVREE